MLRNPSVCEIESSLLTGARKYFLENKYTEVTVPHLTAATGSCENMDTLFSLNYFGKEVFLAQTGQLYLETLVDKYRKVYCLGPSFRAEPRADHRHLTEFPLLEIELLTDFKGLLVEIENLFASMFTSLEENTSYNNLHMPPFHKLRYVKAIEILGKRWGDDISVEDEQKLVNIYKKPLFVTHFPLAMKFFNMRQTPNRRDVVNSADLILPFGGEAVGAAEREHVYERLVKRLTMSEMFQQLVRKNKGLGDFEWYLDYYKTPRSLHSGCGIGLSRVVQYVLKENDIRNCVPYPQNRELLW